MRRQIQTNKMFRDKTFFHILYPILSIYNIQAKHNYTQLLLYYLWGGGTIILIPTKSTHSKHAELWKIYYNCQGILVNVIYLSSNCSLQSGQKIKHQATCLDLSQKSSSSNTPTSDYYMKHYHQPKCNQPGHNFVDEDQRKNLWTFNKTQNIWTLKTSPLFFLLVVEYLWACQKKFRKSGVWKDEKYCTTPTLLWYTQVTQEYSYMNRYGCPPAEALLTNLSICCGDCNTPTNLPSTLLPC